jgi:uncharacterized Zn-binding protein involved in type VI secretion
MRMPKAVGMGTIWVLLAGCSDRAPAPPDNRTPDPQFLATSSAVSVTTPVELGDIVPVAAVQGSLGPNVLPRHQPADQAFASLKASFAKGSYHKIRLAVYDLALIADVSALAGARAASLGMANTEATVVNTTTGPVQVDDGTWELSVDPKGGGEFFVNPSRHHHGVETNALLSDDSYVTKAAAYVAAKLPALTGPQARYAEQVHHFHNSGVTYAVGADPTTRGVPTDGIYEVSVVHNTTIDGLPVIGPGGKQRVWMSPTGDVLAHKSSVRAIAGRHALLTGDQLVNPADARVALESKLAARGVYMSQYTLGETQFGYLCRDNGVAQGLIAPYYIFVYTAVVGKQKTIVETVPAVSDPRVLADIVADEASASPQIPAPAQTPKSGP